MNRILKKWGLTSLLAVFMLAFIVGCSTEEEATGDQDGASQEEESNGEEITEESQFPVTVTDDAGNEITIDEEPETVVSIQASYTEISYALGLGDKMIGVSDFCNYPEEAMEVETVGGQDMNAELILSLLPDVALVTDYHHQNHPEILAQFEEAGIDVIVIGSATSFADTYEKIDLIGEVTGATAEASELITDMQNRHEEIIEKADAVTDKKKVWVEVSPAPDIFTTGQNTFMHEMLESIQATNAAGDQEGWVALTEEEIVQLNPEVIITTYHSDDLQEEISSRDGWAEVPAVKNEQIFDVDNDTVVRPGPRLIEGVETLAKLIYPDIFE
ncbi:MULTISPECIES: ABC transporter substrate-binding protein [Bacillaceae]|uniref:ABC transporter substrate-binding protein n=1 Tax=Alteribacter populi TaxID=2011011 RepID=UPI0018E287DD|nr:ABC transporter substrate-binding protein [Alteribacter populi]